MRETVTITATMVDGTVIEETASDFGEFAGLVLGFRRDADVVSLTWHATPEPPAEELLESGACPWNLSNDLDEELWEAQAREAGCWPVQPCASIQPGITDGIRP